MRREAAVAALPPFLAKVQRRALTAVLDRHGQGLSFERCAAEALGRREHTDGILSNLADRLGESKGSERQQQVGQAFEALWGRPPRRQERRAIEQERLGLDALLERGQIVSARLEAQAFVAFHLASAWARVAPEGSDEYLTLAASLAQDRSWRLASAGFEALRVQLELGRSLPPEIEDRAWARLKDSDGSPWVRAAAMDFLSLTQPAAVTFALSATGEPEDAFLRGQAVQRLAADHPGLAISKLPELVRDPSEHVRMEAISALTSLGVPEAVLAFLKPTSETSPRVRAVAALALGRSAPEAVVEALLGDPSELTRRAALEALEPHAVQLPAAKAAIEKVAVEGSTPELRRWAAEAAERLHHQTDPEARAALEVLRTALQSRPELSTTRVGSPLSPGRVGRALAVLSSDDHGLSARRSGGGWTVLRGDRLARRLWRAWHEMQNPSPDKRQSYAHTVGRVSFGEVRAPPGGLAEVTATKVPGERVVVPQLGEWGRHLPTVDDLLSWPRGGRVELYCAFGVTTIHFPSRLRWLGARLAISGRYAELSRLRWTALTAPEARDRQAYSRALAGLGFQVAFAPHRGDGPAEIVGLFAGGGAPQPQPAFAIAAPVAEAMRQLLDPSASSLNHLAALGTMTLGLFFLRLNEARRSLEAARAAIPLTVGGWGTRGKSGTERLKAALFQGLGAEVLVKTTGCEAMLIHCVPDVPAQEVFIYRTYDKASIWEQRDLLELAARMQVDVFLWECMALNPSYVEILEQQWMRDDYCTLTNTYPDHENIQGPAGVDIPRVMTRFIPRNGTLFTAEEQMTPILRDAARAAQTELIQISWRDHALIPADLLARFPYDEHPRNIALVLALAARLGIGRAMALKEMADWVVPDLGVLKTYPEVEWRGRRLVFSNGMSANERTGFLNNWTRCELDKQDPASLGEWVVTVVNNRADRVSRSMVFADIIVEDASAHAQVFIGTNLAGLSGFVAEALRKSISGVTLLHPDERSLPRSQLWDRIWERVERHLRRIKLLRLGPERLALEATTMAQGLGSSLAFVAEDFAGLIGAGSTLVEQRARLELELRPRLAERLKALAREAADVERHLFDLAAKHALILRWRAELEAALALSWEAAEAVAQRFAGVYQELFLASLVPLWDSGLSGDQVVDAIARSCPPGYRVRIMGIQNIKGTGLDFAYRWVSLDGTARRLRQLQRRSGAEAVKIAQSIAEAEGLGVLDGALALPELAKKAERDPKAAEIEAAATRLRSRMEERHRALESTSSSSGPAWIRPLEKVLDVWDGLARRRRADGLVQALADGTVSQGRAAAELRELMKRQKGGWLRRRPK